MRIRYLALLITLMFAVSAPATAGRFWLRHKLPSSLTKLAKTSTPATGASGLLSNTSPESYTPTIKLYEATKQRQFGFSTWKSRKAAWAKVYKTGNSDSPCQGAGFQPPICSMSTVVPEPGSIIALSVGLVGLAARLRRRTK